MTKLESCDRCNSKIVGSPWTGRYDRSIRQYNGDDRRFTEMTVTLCSTCENELYEWVTGDAPDRSDKMEPNSYDKIRDSVETHIAELEYIIEEFGKAVDNGE